MLAASLVCAVGGRTAPGHEQLAQHIWRQGALEVMAFGSSAEASGWVADAVHRRPSSVQVAQAAGAAECPVRARAGRVYNIFDVAVADEVDRLIVLLSVVSEPVRLQCFCSMAAARALVGGSSTVSTTRSVSSSVARAPIARAPIARRARLGGSVSRVRHRRYPPAGVAASLSPPDVPYARGVLSLMEQGQNIFVTGDAGSGKTTLLKSIAGHLAVLDPAVGVCATTGIAACLLGGLTLHSWLGLVPEALAAVAAGAPSEQVAAILPLPARRRIRTARFLVVDEMSMLDAALLNGVDLLCQFLRARPRAPMGGLTVLFGGDFVQLGPVPRQGLFTGVFAFRSAVWSALLGGRAVVLDEAHRHSRDVGYLNLLRRLRRADLTDADEAMLRSRVVAARTVPVPVSAVSLFATKTETSECNRRRLRDLGQCIIPFTPEDRRGRLTAEAPGELLDSLTLAPRRVDLSVGAAVLANSNVYFHRHGVCAGCRGVVISFQRSTHGVDAGETLPLVAFKLTSGHVRRVLVGRCDFLAASVFEPRAAAGGSTLPEGPVRRQLPLVLGWALTIHKAQGMTLDIVYIAFSCVFTFSMVYVACSRVRSLNSLFLHSFDASLVVANKDALDFHKSLVPHHLA